jgi:hypothetical protein
LTTWSVIAPGFQPVWLVTIPCALLGGHHLARFQIIKKEVHHGRNRRTEADNRDPQADGTADASGAASGVTAGTSTSVTTHWGSYFAPMASYSEDAAVPAPIDTVQEDMPILAHRAARLIPKRGGLMLGSINKGEVFGVDGDAECKYAHDPLALMGYYGTRTSMPRPCDPIPGLHCQCGWYAVPADAESWHDDTTVDLLVELSGRVIEHEKGYRAEHQRVVEVRLPGCIFCGEQATVALFASDNAGAGFACDDHIPFDRIAVTVDAIAKRLGVPVVADH